MIICGFWCDRRWPASGKAFVDLAEPVSRIRALGTAVGEAAAELDKRVLYLGSGGLSHDPPGAGSRRPPRVADALIEGHPPTPEQRVKGEERVIQAGRDSAAGSTTRVPINPEWDNLLLDLLKQGYLAAFHAWTVDWMGQQGGGSGHEVRTWIAWCATSTVRRSSSGRTCSQSTSTARSWSPRRSSRTSRNHRTDG